MGSTSFNWIVNNLVSSKKDASYVKMNYFVDRIVNKSSDQLIKTPKRGIFVTQLANREFATCLDALL